VIKCHFTLCYRGNHNWNLLNFLYTKILLQYSFGFHLLHSLTFVSITYWCVFSSSLSSNSFYWIWINRFHPYGTTQTKILSHHGKWVIMTYNFSKLEEQWYKGMMIPYWNGSLRNLQSIPPFTFWLKPFILSIFNCSYYDLRHANDWNVCLAISILGHCHVNVSLKRILIKHAFVLALVWLELNS
jgi:hypothetical protein